MTQNGIFFNAILSTDEFLNLNTQHIGRFFNIIRIVCKLNLILHIEKNLKGFTDELV